MHLLEIGKFEATNRTTNERKTKAIAPVSSSANTTYSCRPTRHGSHHLCSWGGITWHHGMYYILTTAQHTTYKPHTTPKQPIRMNVCWWFNRQIVFSLISGWRSKIHCYQRYHVVCRNHYVEAKSTLQRLHLKLGHKQSNLVNSPNFLPNL